MALSIFLESTLNGNGLEETENSTAITNMGGEDVAAMIEVQELSLGIEAALEASGRHSVGHHRCLPVTFMCRFGKTSPQFMQGADRNEEFEGTFKLFRNNLQTGEVESLGTVALSRGRIAGVRMVSPNTLDSDGAGFPTHMVIQLMPHTLTVTSADGTEAVIDWTQRG